MIRPAPTLRLSVGLCAGLLVFAFIAAPNSCEWGLPAYFWAGIGVIVVLFGAPLVWHREEPVAARALRGFAWGGIGLLVWSAGLFLANVRIMCRLF